MDHGSGHFTISTTQRTSLNYPPSKYYEGDGPRPPVPGQEDLRRTLSQLKLDLERRAHTDCSGNFDMTDDNAVRWARSLGDLLRDEEGVQLLSHHLDAQRSSNKPLMFWLACQGLKRTAFSPDDRDLLHRRVKAIYRTFLRTSGAGNAQPLPVSAECRRSVRDRINACGNSSVNAATAVATLDPSIFDEPLAQVEAYLQRGVYPSFLRSDLYLERLRSRANPDDAPAITLDAGAQTTRASQRYPLPPLPEDGEWEMPSTNSHPNTTHARVRPQQSSVLAGANGGKEALLRDAAYFYSPSLPYHSSPSGASAKYHLPYSTNVLPSAMDSERQSMSSEAFSEDPTTASGSEISAGPSSVSARQQTNERGKMFVNKSHHNYETGPNAACSALSRCLAASGPAGPGRKSLRHQNNKILKEHTTHNNPASTTTAGSGTSFNCDPLTFIPKMPQPTNTMPPSDPKMFVSVLTEKLNAVLKEREKDEKLGDSIRRLHMQEGEMEGLEGGCCNSKIAPMPCSIYPGSIMDDNSQSILDEHVSRVWKDSPPLQLPTSSTLDPSSTSRHKLHHNLKSSPYRSKSPPNLGLGNLSAARQHHPLSRLPCPAATLNVTVATAADHVHSTLEAAAASLSACSVAPDQLTYHVTPVGPLGTSNVGANMTPTNTQYHPAPLQTGKNNDKIYNWLSHTQKYVGTTTSNGGPLQAVLGKEKSGLPQQQIPYNAAIIPASCSQMDGRNLSYGPGGKAPYTNNIQIHHNPYLNVGQMPRAPPHLQQSGMASTRPLFGPASGHLKRSSSTSSGVSSLISCCAPPPPQGGFPHPLRTSSVGGGDGRGGPTGYDTSSSAFVSELEEDSVPPAPGPKQSGGTCVGGESTVVGYYFCNEPVPYRTKLPCKNVTLGQFKALLRKKGNYRYYFKTVSDEFQTGVINEEISDDEQILPLWEGKIFAKVELIEPDT